MDLIICLILSAIIIGFIVNTNLTKKVCPTEEPINKSKSKTKFKDMFDLKKFVDKFKKRNR